KTITPTHFNRTFSIFPIYAIVTLCWCHRTCPPCSSFEELLRNSRSRGDTDSVTDSLTPPCHGRDMSDVGVDDANRLPLDLTETSQLTTLGVQRSLVENYDRIDYKVASRDKDKCPVSKEAPQKDRGLAVFTWRSRRIGRVVAPESGY
ncbi:hypothetical protein J6590_042810, partial [Homalodisca vitripennis]